jgi:hypothetical protein
MTRAQVLQAVADMVAYASSLCQDVEFSPEDAGRSDPEFLYLVLEAAIRAGASTLNIPDTVGYTVPEEYGALIAGIMQHTPGIQKCIVSTHCHDDLGLATANTLAGVRAGARQVEVTINGIGERAGNSSLEEVVMALQTRRPLYGFSTASMPKLFIDLHLVHEVTSPQAFAGLRARGLKVRRPDLTLGTCDHSTPTTPPRCPSSTPSRARRSNSSRRTAPSSASPTSASRTTRASSTSSAPERVTQPGMTVVCGDSHTSHPRRVRRAGLRHRHQRSRARAGHAVPAAAQVQDVRRPRGWRLPPGVTAKDIILA